MTTPVLIPFGSHAEHPRGDALLSRVAIIVLGEKVSRAVPARIAIRVSDVIPLGECTHEAQKFLTVYPAVNLVNRVTFILTVFYRCADMSDVQSAK